MRPRGAGRRDTTDVITMREEGKSLNEIAAALGVTKQCVWGWIKRDRPDLCKVMATKSAFAIQAVANRQRVECQSCGAVDYLSPSKVGRKFCNHACMKAFTKRAARPGSRLDILGPTLHQLRAAGFLWREITDITGIVAPYAHAIVKSYQERNGVAPLSTKQKREINHE